MELYGRCWKQIIFIKDTEITDTINSVLSNEIKKWGIESLSRFRSNGASAITGHKKSFTLPLKKVHFLWKIIIYLSIYTYNKIVHACVSVHCYEKTVPRRATKFHMKILRYLNVCTWDLDFKIFLLLLLFFFNF